MNPIPHPITALARLRWFDAGRPNLALAIVDAGSDRLASDLESALSAAEDGVLVRRCAGLAGLERIEIALRVAEARTGRADGATRIVASMADSARAVLALQKPVIASPRLIGLTWDRGSLRADLGCAAPSPLLDQARLQLLFAAAAANIPAFDGALTDDTEADDEIYALGFKGVCVG